MYDGLVADRDTGTAPVRERLFLPSWQRDPSPVVPRLRLARNRYQLAVALPQTSRRSIIASLLASNTDAASSRQAARSAISEAAQDRLVAIASSQLATNYAELGRLEAVADVAISMVADEIAVEVAAEGLDIAPPFSLRRANAAGIDLRSGREVRGLSARKLARDQPASGLAGRLRQLQRIAAAQDALAAAPDRPEPLEDWLDALRLLDCPEQALAVMDRIRQRTRRLLIAPNPSPPELERRERLRQEWTAAVERATSAVARASVDSPLRAAQLALDDGCPELALRQLPPSPTGEAATLAAEAMLLLGRFAEARELTSTTPATDPGLLAAAVTGHPNAAIEAIEEIQAAKATEAAKAAKADHAARDRQRLRLLLLAETGRRLEALQLSRRLVRDQDGIGWLYRVAMARRSVLPPRPKD